ncbi:MAG TPA: thiolase domain-containing protein [Patescibacteria group bacterium]|nr:thiolase domain-containing protein [Patescibacteria group bacterium]
MNIAVLGVATTKFGELWDTSPRVLVREAVNGALADAQVALEDIDAIYVGNMLSGMLGNQENLGAFYAEELGITAASTKVEGACASGGLAVHQGVLGILSGLYRRVLVIGVEKMTDHKPEHVASALMGAGSDGERIAGLTFPGLYALMAHACMQKYAITESDMAAVAVKNHYHASLNTYAHFSGGAGSRSAGQMTIEHVMQSPYVADPLKLLDCSPISDGAAAVILGEAAKTTRKSTVHIVGSSVATDTLDLADRSGITSISATVRAAQGAYKQAKLAARDIDVAEAHDCFTIAELMALVDLGFSDGMKKAAQQVGQGAFTLNSSKKLVVNPSGGLKACGHPVGATGVKQIVEITQQLRGEAGKRQAANAHIGLTHNVGGSGAVAVVHLLRS